MRNHGDARAGSGFFEQARERCLVLRGIHWMKMAPAYEIGRERRYQVNVVQPAQARHPPGLVSAHGKVALEGGAHLEIVAVTVDVIFESLNAGAAGALRI